MQGGTYVASYSSTVLGNLARVREANAHVQVGLVSSSSTLESQSREQRGHWTAYVDNQVLQEIQKTI